MIDFAADARGGEFVLGLGRLRAAPASHFAEGRSFTLSPR
jgi:hypothetical protein